MKRLADVLIGYSCKVRPGERVHIGSVDTPPEMICALIDRTVESGGIPFVQLGHSRVIRSLYMHASAEQMDILARRDLDFMKEMHHYIGLVGEENVAEISDVPDEKMQTVIEHWGKPITDYRMKQTNWVILRWPTPSMAQLVGMSTEAFENFFFDVCTLDYGKMARAEEPLKERMMSANMVHIKGGPTDLTFSIADIPAVMCAGDRNIPDGELYTAPVKESVNGTIHFNAGTIYHGKAFDNIRLVFKNGKVVEATSSNTTNLNDILDMDEGARYLGEFSLGFNPRIKRTMRDILFDEKIAGSIHIAPGQAYADADNGNRSNVHWDMVLIQTPEFGGGEIWFDNELIRKDGRFVPEYLHGLNPENLI
ncbi:MAG: aminopeptidase [Armatimonadota bacterium]